MESLLRLTQTTSLTKYVIRLASLERYFYGLALTAMFGLGISLVISHLAISGRVEVLTHLTLSLTEIFGLVIVLTMAPRMIIDAINNRQVYVLLSRPLPRWTYVIGTYMGLFSFIALCTIALAALATFLRFSSGGAIQPVWFASIGTILLTLTTLAAAAMFFSTFSSKLLTAFFTFGLFLGGNGVSLILQYADKSDGLTKLLLQGLAKFLPNLEGLNLKLAAVYNLQWATGDLYQAIANCIAWQIVFIFGAVLIFRERNLK